MSETRKSLLILIATVFVSLIFFYMIFTHNVITKDGIVVIPKQTMSYKFTIVHMDNILECYNCRGLPSNKKCDARICYIISKLEEKGLVVKLTRVW